MNARRSSSFAPAKETQLSRERKATLAAASITVAIFLSVFAGQVAAADVTPRKPNIVYILADDMGYGDPGYMGSKDLRTPNIDKLARGGTILSSFYVQSVCSPTRACLMTGRYVTHTGVYTIVGPNAPWGLPLAERTLAQALREAGYETAIDGKWHLGEFQPAYRPLSRGFDHQYGLWYGEIDYFTHLRGKVVDWHREDQPCSDEGYSTNLITKEACRLIREKNPDKPLFLYLPYNAVHVPLHEAHESYKQAVRQSAGEERRIYAGMTRRDGRRGSARVLTARSTEKGIRDNTLIIFSSDNGGYDPGQVTDNGPLRAGKTTIYEGGMRVCACVNWPGHIPAGKTVDELLHAVDWYPTLIKLGGGSLEQKLPLDGLDIWPTLTAGAKSPHDALLLCGRSRNRTAIRAGDWKLLIGPREKNSGGPGERAGEPKNVELYNLATDIGEQHDLAAEQPEKVKELRAKLDACLMKTAVPPGGECADWRDRHGARRVAWARHAHASASTCLCRHQYPVTRRLSSARRRARNVFASRIPYLAAVGSVRNDTAGSPSLLIRLKRANVFQPKRTYLGAFTSAAETSTVSGATIFACAWTYVICPRSWLPSETSNQSGILPSRVARPPPECLNFTSTLASRISLESYIGP